jgi:ribosomal protein S17
MPPMAFTGTVIKQGFINKTVTVTVRRQFLHKRTGKARRSTFLLLPIGLTPRDAQILIKLKKFLVHDEENSALPLCYLLVVGL